VQLHPRRTEPLIRAQGQGRGHVRADAQVRVVGG
jgi:hypothetical protein